MIKYKTKMIVLLFINLSCFKGQLYRCKSIEELFKSDKFYLKQKINTNYFNYNKISKNITGAKYLGGGSFGQAYKLTVYESTNMGNKIVRSDDDRKIDIAMKAIKYDDNSIAELNNELQTLQTITKVNPLYHLQFYSCGVNTKNTAVVFTEKLDFDMDSDDFKTKLNRFNLQQKLEQALMIAIGVKKLHIEGFGHFDLKPENIMFKNGTYLISKLIDFGMAAKPFRDSSLRGTIQYIAPEIVNGNGLSRVSDTYSLGLVLYSFFGHFMDDMAFSNKIQFYVKTNRDKKYSARVTKVKSLFNRLSNDARNSSDPNKRTVLKMFGDLIAGMIDVDSKTRTDIFQVVSALEKMLKKYDEDSIYLEFNEPKLFAKVYPDYKADRRTIAQPLNPFKAPSRSLFSKLTSKLCPNKSENYDVIGEMLGKTYKKYSNQVKQFQMTVPMHY